MDPACINVGLLVSCIGYFSDFVFQAFGEQIVQLDKIGELFLLFVI
jgi:hypothetical protein